MNARTVIALLATAAFIRSSGSVERNRHPSPALADGLHILTRHRTPADTATLADFSWIAGRWTGTVDGSPVEEICSRPAKGLIMCMFRVFDDRTNVELEVRTFKETRAGVEERVRFLSPDSGSVPPGEVFLMLRSLTARAARFENPRETQPRGETILQPSVGAMVERIEMEDADGKPQIIEAHFVKRAP